MTNDRDELSFMLGSCFSKLFEELEIDESEYVFSEDDMRGACPVHDSDNPTSFAYYIKRNLWFCWTKGCHKEKGSDLVGLIAKRRDITIKMACKWAQKFLRRENITLESASQTGAMTARKQDQKEVDYWREHTTQKPFKESCLKKLHSAEAYLKGRKIDLDLAAEHGIGYAKTGSMSGRVVIPVRRIDGRIVGFTGRQVKERESYAKWIHLPKKRFHTRFNLFNLHRAAKSIRRSNSVILVEGPWDSMKIDQAGFTNSAAVFGLSVSKGQIEILKRLGVIHVFLGFDPDKLDSDEVRDTISKLQSADFEVQKITWEGSEDFGAMKIKKIQRVLSQFEAVPGFAEWRKE